MAKSKKKTQSVISLRALCEKSDIAYHRVYSFINGTYRSLTNEERKALMNTLIDESAPILKELGFAMQLRPIKDQE